MKIEHYKKTPARKIKLEGSKDVKIRWLISQKENAPHFAMRMLEVEPGGHTPYHSHDNEHEVFVYKGIGTLVIESESKDFEPGFVIYVPPAAMHQFRNRGNETLEFLCLIPNEKPQ